MSETTEIAWCDSTFNPWIGCTKVGPGCDNCYAEREFDHRHHKAKWGPGNPRTRTSAANWKKPVQWNAKPFYECDCGWRGDKLDEHTRACGYPEIGRIKPARRRVFCASLADVFDNEVPAQWRVDLLRLIADTPNLDWLLLTKRIGNVQRMMVEAFSMGWPNHAGMWERWPEMFKNVWLGATICNQPEADRDIPKLLAVPAAVRFISMEPLLGPVDLTPAYLPCQNFEGVLMDPETGAYDCCRRCDYTGISNEMGIDWVIVGGESGPRARPMHPDWVRGLRDQCAAAGVPLLFKQWGEWTEEDPGEGPHSDCAGILPNGDVAKYSEGYVAPWDTGERLKQSGGVRLDGRTLVFRVGKKLAGRLLDGKLHDEYPKVAP